MKFLFINSDIGYGGASKMIVFVANCLSKRNHDVTFLTFRNREVFQELDKGVKHVHFDWEKDTGNSIFVMLKTIISLHKFLKKENYDWAVAFLSPSQVRLAFAAQFTNTKILFSQRGDPYSYLGSKCSPLYLLHRFAFSLADSYVFQTNMAKEFYNKAIQRKGTVIGNPIDTPPEEVRWDIKNTKKKIVSVGRMDLFQKRHDILISAFNIFSKLHPEYSLEFYGDGADLEKIKELAVSNEKIVFHGAVKNVLSNIVDARMFVMTSDFEGIPNALLEAMSIGMPCISTNCSPGGAALLIDNYVNGILVPRGDVNEVYLAMERFAQDEAMTIACGEKAKLVTEQYSNQRIAEQWENFILNA